MHLFAPQSSELKGKYNYRKCHDFDYLEHSFGMFTRSNYNQFIIVLINVLLLFVHSLTSLYLTIQLNQDHPKENDPKNSQPSNQVMNLHLSLDFILVS